MQLLNREFDEGVLVYKRLISSTAIKEGNVRSFCFPFKKVVMQTFVQSKKSYCILNLIQVSLPNKYQNNKLDDKYAKDLSKDCYSALE